MSLLSEASVVRESNRRFGGHLLSGRSWRLSISRAVLSLISSGSGSFCVRC